MIVQEKEKLSLVEIGVMTEDCSCHLYLRQKSGLLAFEESIQVLAVERGSEVAGNDSIGIEHRHHNKITVFQQS